MSTTRQFEVVHTATGTVTRVVAPIYGRITGSSQVLASIKAGHRYPADCTVRVVPRGQEIPLPFDCIPLVLRRANHDH